MPVREIRIRLHLNSASTEAKSVFDLEFVGDDMHENLSLEQVQKFIWTKVEDAAISFD